MGPGFQKQRGDESVLVSGLGSPKGRGTWGAAAGQSAGRVLPHSRACSPMISPVCARTSSRLLAGVQRAAPVWLSHVASPQQGPPKGPGAGDPRSPFGRSPCPDRWHDPTKMSFALAHSESSNVQVTPPGGPARPAAAARARTGFTRPSVCVSSALNSETETASPDSLWDLR